MKYADKWMEIEKLRPHGVTQSQKDKHGMDSHVDTSCLLVKTKLQSVDQRGWVKRRYGVNAYNSLGFWRWSAVGGAGWEQVVGRECGERWQDLGDIQGMGRRPSA